MYIIVAIWVIILALLILFLNKYKLVNAKRIEPKNCKHIKEKDGFVLFEYEMDFGKGNNILFGKARSTGRTVIGKEYKILVTKDYDERVIVFADVVKLVIAMIFLTLLLIILGFSGIDMRTYLL